MFMKPSVLCTKQEFDLRIKCFCVRQTKCISGKTYILSHEYVRDTSLLLKLKTFNLNVK